MPSSPSLLATVGTTRAERLVLEAADSLFTEHSIDWVTLDAVAARAQIDVADLTRQHATKRDLLIAVLGYKHQGWVRRLERNALQVTDPRDEILEVFSYLEECFADDTWRGCCFVNAYAEVGREDVEIEALAVEHFDEVERHMSVLCARAGLPRHVSDGLTLLVQGARTEAGIHHTAQPARSARIAAALLMSIYDVDDTAPIPA